MSKLSFFESDMYSSSDQVPKNAVGIDSFHNIVTTEMLLSEICQIGINATRVCAAFSELP